MNNISLPQLPYDPDKIFDKPLVEVTQSACSTFFTCPAKFVFRYLYLLIPGGVYSPFVVGTAVHKGMEILLDPNDARGMYERLDEALAAADATIQKHVDSGNLSPGDEHKLDYARAQVSALLEAWLTTYVDEMEGWRLKASELVVRSVPGATIESPIADRMAGMIDGVLVAPDSRTWLLEHKTRSNLFSLKVVGLNANFQALWYMIMYRNRYVRQTGEQMPVGFLYDVLAKPKHRMNSSGWEELRERMFAAIVADPSKYLHVEPIEVTEEQLRFAEDNLGRVVRAMDSLRPDTVFHNYNSCMDYGGCPYIPLCYNQVSAGNPHQVLTHESLAQFVIAQPHTELVKEGLEDKLNY